MSEARGFAALDWVNAGASVVALGLACLAALATGDPVRRFEGGPELVASDIETVRLPDGSEGLKDATGEVVPLKQYHLIASASTLADQLLIELVEPERLAAFTKRSSELSPERHRYQGKAVVYSLDEPEPLLKLDPDLVLVNNIAGAARVARLREAGLRVFDLGELRGLSTLLPSIRRVALLIGHRERGERLIADVRRRLFVLEHATRAATKPKGLYVSVVADKLYGGTRGTSYHDVLTYGGLMDVAAEQYRDWPRYTSEQLLALDPDIVVTNTGMAEPFCAHPGLGELSVCAGTRQILELDPEQLGDPGLGLVKAAEQLFVEVQARADAVGKGG